MTLGPAEDLVDRFWYTTALLGARYRLVLGGRAVRMDLTIDAPYVLSVGQTWQRVASTTVDYTTLLERTDLALQHLTHESLEWRLTIIASDQGGFLSSHARLNDTPIKLAAFEELREQLPKGCNTRYRTYAVPHPED